jgi:hypothetical protein
MSAPTSARDIAVPAATGSIGASVLGDKTLGVDREARLATRQLLEIDQMEPLPA